MPSSQPSLSTGIDRFSDRFWRPFGTQLPSFEGKTVLEVGCGEGDRCLEAAAYGAARVVGVDPYAESIAIARGKLAEVSDRVVFFEGTLPMLPPEKFDIIISENTLEHVLDVPELLEEIASRLRSGGRFYLGFGPLYHSYDGDHGLLRAVLPGRRFFLWPWGHLFLTRYAFRQLSKIYGGVLTGTRDWPYLALNQLTFDEYKELFRNSSLQTIYERINYVESLKGRLLTALRPLPVLSRYLTLNMNMIFEVDHSKLKQQSHADRN